jgi:ferredoxin--NADP+ reductase
MSDYLPNAEITAWESLTSDLAIIRVAPKGWTLPPFVPGQYAELAIPPENPAPGAKLIRRSYSIASTPAQSNEVELFIVKVDGGELTPGIFELQKGGTIWLGPKIKGKFTIDDVPPGKDVIMTATGTGLAPFVSMLRTFKEAPPWRNLVILHCARVKEDLGYRAELESYQRDFPWFHYISTLTREPADSSWTGLRGRVHDLFLPSGLIEQKLGAPITPADTHIMMCGNPAMIEELEVKLAARGLNPHKKKAPGNVHVERYW